MHRSPSTLNPWHLESLRDGSQWHLHTGSILLPALSTTLSRWRPGQNIKTPHATFGKLSNKLQLLRVQGPQNLEAYLLPRGVPLSTSTDSRKGCGIRELHFRLTFGFQPACARRTAQPSYFGKYSSVDRVSDQSRAGQLFKISGSSTQAHTRAFAWQRPIYLRGGAHETKNRTASHLRCKLGD